MARSIGFIVGIAVGILLIAILSLLIRRYTYGKWMERSKYDERQKVAQGLAHRAGFWTLIIGLLVLWTLNCFEVELPFNQNYLLLGLMCLGMMVYAIECIFRDAYMGLNDNPRRWILVDGAIVLVNLIIAFSEFSSGLNGWINLMAAAMLGTVMVAFILKQLLNRRAEDGEDA